MFAGVLGVTLACDNAATAPTSRSAPPSVRPVNVTVTGVVRDEAGAPVASALVGYRYFDFYGDEYAWRTTRVDSSGRFELFVESWGGPGTSSVLGRASVDGDDYEPTFQGMLLTPGGAVSDFRLRRVRHSMSDETATVSFDAESGLCFEEGQPFSAESRCETARITVTSRGQVTVDARPAQPGGVIPFVALNGLESSITGRAAAFVQAGHTFRVRLRVPAGTPPGSYIVSTSLQ